MVVKLLYFASFRERVGREGEERRIPDGTKLAELWETLGREVPYFAAFAAMPPAAVNREYAPPETVLREGDEVTFLPPVAGG